MDEELEAYVNKRQDSQGMVFIRFYYVRELLVCINKGVVHVFGVLTRARARATH